MFNQYERFRTIHEYHTAVAQMFWTIERSVMETFSAGPWDDEDLVQTVRDVISAHRRMVAAHEENSPS